ncbi:uncharacterized protein BKCO1_9000191 [Diplodia corticola]|uniref:Uncharacterized protein n=1 Tax=Diplodia corticola TaxID=236234 RepID=A0A1J9R8A9_9PEZI|nr:uncharacterized protein BKCO1_9000191 [Diplodia corticola]OJD36761.1 hypothetical protein BKCO1_9000191 [Diplodia corticola]
MDIYSRQNNGLATVSENHYYLWKYGPTSVLTIMAAVWGQVEYCTKQLMPWVEMMSFLRLSGNFGYHPAPALDHLLHGTFERGIQKYWAPGGYNTSRQAMVHYQVPLPHGTTADFATQSFTLLPITNETVSANDDVFSAEPRECEPLSWKDADPTPTLSVAGNGTTFHNMNISSGTCQLRHYPFPITGEGWTASVRKVECSKFSPTEPDARLLIYLSSSYYETANAGTEDRLSVSDATQEPLPLGVNPEAIIDNVVSSIESDETREAINSPFASNISTWLSLVNETMPQPEVTAWTNETLLSLASQNVFRSFLPQWAKNGKTTPDHRAVAGNATQVLPRLCVQALSLRLMECFWILLCLGSFALCFLDRISLPESPACLMSLALLLSRNPSPAQVLEGSGRMGEKTLAHKLRGLKFWCTPTNQRNRDLSIHVERPEGSQPGNHHAEPGHHTSAVNEQSGASDGLKLWQPASDHLAYRILVITVPMLLVTSLETIYQISLAHDGIADVSLDGYTKYTWVFVPSATMVIVGLLFGALHSTARLLAVFQEMRKRGVGVSAMEFDPFANITLLGFCITLRKGNWPLSAAMLTSLLAPLLTIVTSSLYTPVEVPSTQNMTLTIQDWFDIRNMGKTWWDSTNRGMGLHMSISDLVFFANTSFPQWTYSEAVFPHLTLTEKNNGIPFPAEQRQELHSRIPGIRANMNCTLSHMHRNGHFKTASTSRSLFHGDGALIIPVAIPSGCNRSLLFTPLDGKDDAAAVNFVFDPPADGTSFFFADQVDQLVDLPLSDAVNACGDNRPHLWFAVGHQTANTTDDLALLHCAPYIEALAYTAIFATQNFEINTTAPPIPDESTARPLLLDHNNITTAPFSYAVTLPLVGAGSALRAKNITVPPGISPFFAALVYGAEGTPIEDLVGEDNVPRLIDRMQHLYRQLVAQVLHAEAGAKWCGDAVAGGVAPTYGGGRGGELLDGWECEGIAGGSREFGGEVGGFGG